jgi:5-formyltetrahydrofolate cyclo-ligase
MNPAIVARKSKIITDKIEDIISYLPRPIAFFYPQAGEPDIKKLFSNYWQHQKAILLPKIENKEMFFYQINNINMLTYNSRFKL